MDGGELSRRITAKSDRKGNRIFFTAMGEAYLIYASRNATIDSNQVENAIRPVAIGRKNYLFAGSHEGARRAAMLYSLLGTCKKNDVNPFEWMRDVLQRIPAHHASKLSELLPENWKAAQN